MKNLVLICLSGLLVALSGCFATLPTTAGLTKMLTGKDSELERCSEPLGTVTVFEDEELAWWKPYSVTDLGSTTPVIHQMIHQSNCFTVVDSDADYTLSPAVVFSEKGLAGMAGDVAGDIAADQIDEQLGIGGVGGILKDRVMPDKTTATTLYLTDERSGEQVSAEGYVGYVGKVDPSFVDTFLEDSVADGTTMGAFSDKDGGKAVIMSLAHSYNQMVKDLKNISEAVQAGKQ